MWQLCIGSLMIQEGGRSLRATVGLTKNTLASRGEST